MPPPEDQPPPQDSTAPVATTTGEPATAPAGGPATFTQEQVNALIGQRLAEDRARRTKEPSPKPVEKPAKSTTEDLEREIETLKLRGAFDKRAAKFDLSDSASERLFKTFAAEKPEDPSSWWEATARDFNLKPIGAVTPPTPNSTTPAQPPPAAPRAPDKVDPLTNGGLVDIWNLSHEQISQLGSSGLREAFEKILSVGQQRSGAPPMPKVLQRK